MYETFENKKFTDATQEVIDLADSICREYDSKGLVITLRQLYYQFVARGYLANKQTNYDRLGRIVSDGRLAGMIDWSHLEDRTREITGDISGYMPTPASTIEYASRSYKFDLWNDQQYRVEVWVEKQALADIVSRSAWKWRVATFACKGYVSQSEMYAAGKRMAEYAENGQVPIVIHLGDHDPSGLDMTRDIEDRLSMFADQPVTVNRIALTMDQVREFNPPPNPAKFTDSRVHSYVSKYGYSSWELDALNPEVLDTLVQGTIQRYCDLDAFNEQARIERETRTQMVKVADQWERLVQMLDDGD